VDEACQNLAFVRFLLGYMTSEAAPTLAPVPGIDLAGYQHTLIQRFANPNIRDTLARLSAQGSDRLPKFLLPVIREQLASGGELERSALVVAAWARYAEGADEQGNPIDVVDDRRDQLMRAAGRQRQDQLTFPRQRDLFGDLADQPRFTAVYLAALRSLHTRGALATWKASVRTV
jgi:mannitol 2-dehydrogenase